MNKLKDILCFVYGTQKESTKETIIQQAHDQIIELFRECLGEKELHTHNSIPSYTADLDEGCVICMQNDFIIEAEKKMRAL